MTSLEATSYKWRTTETVPVKVRNEIGMSTFSTPIQYGFGSPSQSNKTRARNKRNSHWEGRIQAIPIFR
jgi:hypothetical protein